jgi:DNA-binding LacI/PurR family transcriptional regulator
MAKATMAQVARELDVSKNTVSLALRHDPQIPAATRERVLAAARRLGYVLNPTVSHLMAELRKSRTRGSQHTLALLNAHRSPDALRTHPTIPSYVDGCRRRAAAQGYGVDQFWLHDAELDGPRLNRILQARGIRGVIVTGLMDDNCLPEQFAATWAEHACVITGVRTRNPTLSFCCVDHHALVLQAVEQALRLGYRRPALAIDERIDRLVDGRFSSGMWVGQQALSPEQRVPSFYQIERSREEPALFYAWLDREKPDVIFTLYHLVRRLLEDRGLRVPRDLGLIQLERRRDREDWAGMDQHNDLTGEAAVDMVVSLLHNNERGIPSFPRAMLVEASWVPGATVRPQASARPRRAATPAPSLRQGTRPGRKR